LSAASVERVISFGPFHLHPDQRLLLAGEKALRIGSRAMEILIVLVEHAGELVGKDELMARVWPDTIVEESNLKVHIAMLRRLLGEGQDGNRYIQTVAGRGYQFVAPIASTEGAGASPRSPPKHKHNLPSMMPRLVGREEVIEKLVRNLPRQHLVTIVGTGGVGTTSVALAAAERLLPVYENGVWLVDLAPLSDPGLVPAVLAMVLGREIHGEDLLSGLLGAIVESHMLVVLDNCERVIDAAAQLAGQIRRRAPGVDVLATSREPLRAGGEHVLRLQPLDFPPSRVAAAEALTYPAIQLFVERAAANLAGFELTDEIAPFVADICAKLDGVPLAIEFAAARVDTLGIRSIAANLEDRLRLPSRRRPEEPRHRTMEATLDWSYDGLTELERTVLQRLSIFAGAFPLAAATGVAGHENSEPDIVDTVANLVGKSLVTVDVRGDDPLFRLFEFTRLYARERLAESGETQRLCRRHAEYHRDLLEGVEAEWGLQPVGLQQAGGAETHHLILDEVRTALDWAFSPGGDASIGVALTVSATPLWLELSLLAEARERIQRALGSIEPGSADQWATIKLDAGFGTCLFFTTARSAFSTAAWSKSPQDSDDTERQLSALWRLWTYRTFSCDFTSALALTRRYRTIAVSRGAPEEIAIADRQIGVTHLQLGEFVEARRCLETVLDRYDVATSKAHIARFQLDQRVATRGTLARVLWQMGFPDQGMRAAREALEEAAERDHPNTYCYALAVAVCPVSIWSGDLTGAEAAVATLDEHSTRHKLALWGALAKGLRGVLRNRSGRLEEGIGLVRGALEEFRTMHYRPSYIAYLAELAQSLGWAGQVSKGLAIIEEAFDWLTTTDEAWCTSSILRIKGDLLVLDGSSAALGEAETLFSQAYACAREQKALSWELKAAISLAQLWHRNGRIQPAIDLLAFTYGRFEEGSGTADLVAAKQLLLELETAKS